MEVIDLFHEAAQHFSEAKQIADAAVAEKRGMSPEEELRHNTLFNKACDLRASMQQKRAEEASARIATIEGEMAQFINDGGGAGLSEEARRRTRAYHEQFNARSVPYRWHQHGPPTQRSFELESDIPNPAIKEEWDEILERRSALDYQTSMETYLATKPEQLRSAQMDLDEMGGFWLAPIQMINDILKIADDMVYVRQMAEVTPRVDAQALGATFMETDLEDADWNSEIGEISETTAKWGTRVLRPKDMNKYVGMSYRSMMQVPSLSAWLVERLGYKRGITEERAYFVGNGVNEALGAFVASDQGIGTDRDVSRGNSTTDVSLVGLQSALWSIHSGYWDNLVWFGAREFWRQTSLLRRTDGQPIWHMSLDMRHPDRLLGFPAYISEMCPAVFTAGKYVGIIGNWKKGYHIADAYNTTIQRVDQQFATRNLILYIMRACTDGMPVMPAAFAHVQLAKA